MMTMFVKVINVSSVIIFCILKPTDFVSSWLVQREGLNIQTPLATKTCESQSEGGTGEMFVYCNLFVSPLLVQMSSFQFLTVFVN